MMQIKPLGSEDWTIYRDLRLAALKNDPTAFGSSFEEESQYDQATWIRYTKGVYAAMTKDHAVGMIVVFFTTRMKYHHIAEIFGFYVSPEYRGQKIGEKLMEHALKLILENKSIIKVKLTVNVEQQSAVHVYEKFGFKRVGLMKKEMLIDGNYYDEYLMEKCF